MDNKIKTRKIRNVTLMGAIVNIILAGAKITVGSSANNSALIADGIHSMSDLVTDAAVLLGSKFWSKDADSEHPYGHGRIETLVSLAIGALLCLVAFEMAWKAIEGFFNPSHNAPSWLAFIVALISIISKEAIYNVTVRVGRQVKSSAVMANAWHHRTDALSSIPVAIAVVGMKVFPSFLYFDQIATLLVCGMLVKAAWDIAYPCIEEIMETQKNVDINKDIAEIKRKFPEIKEIHKIRVRKVGSVLFVEMHMLFDSDMSILAAHSLTDEVKSALLSRNASLGDVIIHIEPHKA